MAVKRYDSATSSWVTVAGLGAQGPAGANGSDGSAPLTTKGDLLTYSTSATRLGIGSNGETLVADSSATTGLRYNPQNALANPVINGGFDIWQRSTSSAIGAGATFVADRWRGYRSSFATGMTVSRQSVSDSTNLPNIQYCLRGQRDSGNTNLNGYSIYTNLETTNSIPFAGKAITLSFYARAGANYSPSSSALNVYLFTGTGTDQDYLSAYTGSVTAIGSTATLTTTWQRFAFTATLATNMTEMAIRIGADASVGTAGANDWFEVTGVQIDLGTYTASTAPTFRRAGGTLAGELAACQRYYYKVTPTATYQDILNGSTNDSTAYARYCMKFPVTMRTAPTMGTTGTAADYGNLVKTGFAGATGVPTSNDSRVDGITIYLTSASIATGDAPCLRNSNTGVNSNNWLTFSSEL